MIRKLVVFVAAVLVNCVALAALQGWSVAAAARAEAAPRAKHPLVLPAMTVRPTPAQIEMLRRDTAQPHMVRPATEAGDGNRA